MSDEIKNHGQSGHETGFEREDLATRGVFFFMIGLAVFGVIVYFIIVGMYSFLDKYERGQMATASPLVTSKGAMSRVVTQADMDKAFKDNGAPMLEVNERGQMRDFLVNQETRLHTYGWVDEKDGVAHIPIERAMALIVERGLPVYPQSGAAEKEKTAAAIKAPAQKSVEAKP
ncbi:MAG: hypothetical protein WCF68_07055 [Terriglobales bacterium]